MMTREVGLHMGRSTLTPLACDGVTQWSADKHVATSVRDLHIDLLTL